VPSGAKLSPEGAFLQRGRTNPCPGTSASPAILPVGSSFYQSHIYQTAKWQFSDLRFNNVRISLYLGHLDKTVSQPYIPVNTTSLCQTRLHAPAPVRIVPGWDPHECGKPDRASALPSLTHVARQRAFGFVTGSRPFPRRLASREDDSPPIPLQPKHLICRHKTHVAPTKRVGLSSHLHSPATSSPSRPTAATSTSSGLARDTHSNRAYGLLKYA
jgi:hypothetical protein